MHLATWFILWSKLAWHSQSLLREILCKNHCSGGGGSSSSHNSTQLTHLLHLGRSPAMLRAQVSSNSSPSMQMGILSLPSFSPHSPQGDFSSKISYFTHSEASKWCSGASHNYWPSHCRLYVQVNFDSKGCACSPSSVGFFLLSKNYLPTYLLVKVS